MFQMLIHAVLADNTELVTRLFQQTRMRSANSRFNMVKQSLYSVFHSQLDQHRLRSRTLEQVHETLDLPIPIKFIFYFTHTLIVLFCQKVYNQYEGFSFIL